MIHRSAIATLALALSLGCVRLAHAQLPDGPHEDFADEVRKFNNYYHRQWVIERMVTFEVGDACWDNMLNPKNRAITIANTFARNIADYAEKVTGESWNKIEGTSGNERDRGQVNELVEQFRPSFHLTIKHDGADCDVGRESLMLKYWNMIGNLLIQHPPTSKKAIVLLHVTPKVKDFTITVTQDGSTFAITAPAERDVSDWAQKLTLPFQKASRKK